MEPSRFDELTKTLATATSRRQALKTFATTALGGILGLGDLGTVFAKPCKPNGIGCNVGNQCCSGGCCHGTCTDLNTTSNCGSCRTTCDTNQVCQSGRCCLSNGATFPFNCGPGCCIGTPCCSEYVSNDGSTCTCIPPF